MTGTPTETVIAGGTVLTPTDRIHGGVVRIRGSRIVDVGRDERPPADAVDATGKYVLPGFVDLHGDDIERHLAPRPAARVPPETALRRSDVAAISAGITTKLHAIAFENAEDGLRSVGLAQDVAEAVRQFDPEQGALADHRLHLRCELAEPDGVDAVCAELERGATLASLVEHVPGEGQYAEGAETGSYRTDGATAGLDALAGRDGLGEATREHRSSRVVASARSASTPVAAHDLPDPDAVERVADLGVDICEFPLTLDTARAGERRGMAVVLGAPNVARGGSLYGNLDAQTAMKAGCVDVLCSDFRPMGMLESLFVDEGSLSTRLRRLTAAPADALGLSDRGRIRPGARADLIVVDPDPVATVTRAFVAGRETYRVRA